MFKKKPDKFYYPIDDMWKRQIKEQLQKIRARRRNFGGNLRSLTIKQYRGNIWNSARFKKGYAKKLATTFNYRKQLERGLSFANRANFLMDGTLFDRNNFSGAILKYLKKRFYKFKRKNFPRDLVAAKKFYRKFNKTVNYRHTRNLELHRIKVFFGGIRVPTLHKMWNTGHMKGFMYSANLFTLRFIARLPNLLYFSGLTTNLAVAKRLIESHIVYVDKELIWNLFHLVSVLSYTQIVIPKFYEYMYFFLISPFHRIYINSFFEINLKLLSVRLLRLPLYREVVIPQGLFDHMFLYEQLAQNVK